MLQAIYGGEPTRRLPHRRPWPPSVPNEQRALRAISPKRIQRERPSMSYLEIYGQTCPRQAFGQDPAI